VVARGEAELDLGTAALLVAEFEYPELDVAHYLTQLDHFADLASDLAASETGAHRKLRAMNRALFAELGFRGNREDYYDPRNSFLNEVIDRRLGAPISLSVIFLEVGRRLGLDMVGLNFPSHFLVRYRGGDQTLILDPFHLGMTVTSDELRVRLRQALGSEAELHEAYLQPALKRQIVTRMLANLAAVYRRNGDVIRQLAVVERMQILDPDSRRLGREVEQLRRRATELN